MLYYTGPRAGRVHMAAPSAHEAADGPSLFDAEDSLTLFYERIDKLYAYLPTLKQTRPEDNYDKLTRRLDSIRRLLDPGPVEHMKVMSLEQIHKVAQAAMAEWVVELDEWIPRREAAHKRQHLLLLQEADRLALKPDNKKYHGMTVDKDEHAIACEAMFELRRSQKVPGILGVFARYPVPKSVWGEHKKTKKPALNALLPYPGLVDTANNIREIQHRLHLPYPGGLETSNLKEYETIPSDAESEEEQVVQVKEGKRIRQRVIPCVILGDPIRIACQINTVMHQEEHNKENCKLVVINKADKTTRVSSIQMHIEFTRDIKAGEELLLCYDNSDGMTLLDYEEERSPFCDICQQRSYNSATRRRAKYHCPVSYQTACYLIAA